MGRGVSSGGGQSSLGYLFGGNEAPVPRPVATNVEASPRNSAPPASAVATDKSSAVAPSGGDAPKQIPAGIQGSQRSTIHQSPCCPGRWIFPRIPFRRWQVESSHLFQFKDEVDVCCVSL
ncbi:hypothetical protein SASPL_125529 [Salvia splendens]|uniref:Protein SPIRAL1 n=1 Tax=Salvia splendens TaxID=180675 RepID=A0A8X8XHA9_SALSN|nr:hypothetical protein SASPL_125529 [Salvia splendens]